MTAAPRLGWTLLVGGLVSLAASYTLAATMRPDAAVVNWLAVIGIAAIQSGVLAIGAVRSGRLSLAAWLAVATMLLVPLLGFGAALLLGPETATGPYWLGLPRRAAIVLLGVGVLPMLVLPFAYARAHRADALDPAALAELRSEAASLRAGTES